MPMSLSPLNQGELNGHSVNFALFFLTYPRFESIEA